MSFSFEKKIIHFVIKQLLMYSLRFFQFSTRSQEKKKIGLRCLKTQRELMNERNKPVCSAFHRTEKTATATAASPPSHTHALHTCECYTLTTSTSSVLVYVRRCMCLCNVDVTGVVWTSIHDMVVYYTLHLCVICLYSRLVWCALGCANTRR